MADKQNLEILDDIIIGRVTPHIYAFTTGTVPNYLKVGDTYRPVKVRLNEWRRRFTDLKEEYSAKASINDDVYFRDYAVHSYLEGVLQKHRLTSDLFPGVYFSKEFFENTNPNEVQEAVEDIQQAYANDETRRKYDYYDASKRLAQTHHYERGPVWNLRPNQQEAVNNFMTAINAGRTNLLMYAVMRFGKSFTSLCCAKEMGAKTVLVVSAKADVCEEWKKNVERPGNFSEYRFFDASDLLTSDTAIADAHADGQKTVIFLTLQDLQGSEIKDKHKQIFNEKIDLLIVDETHFGARAASFGEVLRASSTKEETQLKVDQKLEAKLEDDVIDDVEADKQIKALDAHVRLHLSGTPYRILMGSEFEPEDVISFVQFSDIAKEQAAWDTENLNNDDVEEWDNPYFGFPQMIRFAFTPSQGAIDKMEELKKSGVSFAFSALLQPRSIKENKKEGLHKQFVHEDEILELLQVIDGSKEDRNLLGFLDYDKIKEGKMCRHMVMVLPFCASCDAMEALIQAHADTFKNLGSYEILNISGVGAKKQFKNPDQVKARIAQCEKEDKKTLTLTVNRMLTGSTVEQWDTMIYLKDTSSPQEYDQAIFRLQNQYVRELTDGEHVIKENLKPQTLLVDFDPNRLFHMQEQKSLIYNVNTEKGGNAKLTERIREELKISPVITMNHDKIQQVEASDIIAAVSQYNNSRSISDEVRDLPVDLSILSDEELLKLVMRQNPFGSREGLTTNAHEGEETDLEIEDSIIEKNGERQENTKEEKVLPDVDLTNKKEIEDLEKRMQTYYQRILFYSFLTSTPVASMDEVIDSLDKGNNARVAKNLGLRLKDLKLLRGALNPFKLSAFDYKIHNISKLATDDTLSPLERATTSLAKFNRMSSSEIITPMKVADEMVELLPEETLRKAVENGEKLLDIASKSGEYAVALAKRLTDFGYEINQIKNTICSIPTSSIAYEFTRRFYEVLGLNVNCIASRFNAYDLLEIRTDKAELDYPDLRAILEQGKAFSEITLEDTPEGDEEVKFAAVVGNPPYQRESIGAASKTNGQKPMTNIFHLFQKIADALSTSASVLIYPGGRWIHQSGKGMQQFGKTQINDTRLALVRFYPVAEEIFGSAVSLSDGITIVYKDFHKKLPGFNYSYICEKNNADIFVDNPGDKLMPLDPRDFLIEKKIDLVTKKRKWNYLHDSILPRSLFAIDSDYVENNPDKVRLYTSDEAIDFTKEIKLFTNDKAGKAGRATWFVANKDVIVKNQKFIGEWQVVVSSANAGGQKRDNQLEFVDNHSAFGRSRLALRSFATEQEAKNFSEYVSSYFIRYTFLLTDESLTSLGKSVPDIMNYSDEAEINFSENVDKQLCEIFEITDSEFAYMRSRVESLRGSKQ